MAAAVTVAIDVAGSTLLDATVVAPTVSDPPVSTIAPRGTPATTTAPTAAPSSGIAVIDPYVMSQTFVSGQHGYQVRHPAGWTELPAASTDAPDVLRSPDGYRFEATSREAPTGMTLDGWARANTPTRVGDQGRCISGLPWRETGRDRWVGATIDGHEALVRAKCGFIDGVVSLGARRYSLTLQTGSPSGARWLFDRFVETFQFVEVFTSDVYGYSLRHPIDGWTTTPATEPWSGSGPWDRAPGADTFLTTDLFLAPPTGGLTVNAPDPDQFTVTAFPSPVGGDLDAWLAEHVPDRPEVRSEFCRFQAGGGVLMIPGNESSRWGSRVGGAVASWMAGTPGSAGSAGTPMSWCSSAIGRSS
jgi:hypothetical protein